MKRFTIIILLCVGKLAASPSPPPTAEQVLRYEPQIYFLLGISASKTPATWEYFYPNESKAAEVYDHVAHFLAIKFGFTDGEASESDNKKEARWRAKFIEFIDRYYSHSYSEFDGHGLVLDTQRLSSDVHRSSSLDAFLAGAYLRNGESDHFHGLTPAKAQVVATLLNRHINTGVIIHTFVGYIPGGSSVEFKETSVLRKIFDSWRQFAETPSEPEASYLSGGAITGKYAIRLTNQEIGKKATDELANALRYELDRTEVGFVASSSYGMKEIEVEIAVFDVQRGLAAIRRVLEEYAVPANSKITQESPTKAELPVYAKDESNGGAKPRAP